MDITATLDNIINTSKTLEDSYQTTEESKIALLDNDDYGLHQQSHIFIQTITQDLSNQLMETESDSIHKICEKTPAERSAVEE